MEPLEIKKYPDSTLRKKALEIKEITDKEIKLFEEMLFTMRHFAGIGLAAPQIGIAKNLIVADIGEGAPHNDAHGVVNVGGFQFIADIGLEDAFALGFHCSCSI